ncbi:MAG: Rpn family recombination-promoting nuclease/putative transposase [Acidobacteriota bacterium]
MVEYANSYLLLFSHPYLIESLIRGFVPGAWVDDLDFGTLEKVGASYATDDLRSRHDDLIWRVQRRDGQRWVYVYLLIEFQSTDERFMAVRIMTYQGLLYQDLIRQHHLGRKDRLPQVLPIVLYSGNARWRSPTDVSELVHQGPEELAPYRPRARFLLLDEGALHERAMEIIDNPVASLFLLAHAELPEARAAVRSLRASLKASQHAHLRRAYITWYHNVLRRREKHVNISEIQTLEDVDAMLTEETPSWTAQWMKKGERVGESKMLLRQLQARFGTPDHDLLRRVEAASSESLIRWSERILTAERVEDVFSP